MIQSWTRQIAAWTLGLVLLLPAASQAQGYNISGPTPGNLLRTTTDAITTGGTNIHLSSAGGGTSVNAWSAAQNIPFPFNFYGVNVTQFCVSKNGLITFDASVAGTTVNANLASNTALPNPNLPPLTIAGFWGDFSPPIGSGDDVWMFVEGTAPNRQLWILNFSYKIDALSFAYFATVLEETSNNLYVVDMWATTTGGTFTVGAQLNGTTAVQVGASPNLAMLNTSSANTDNDYYTFTALLDNDAALANLSPDVPFCPGTYPVSVDLVNNGQNNLTSATINWSIDGVPQTPVNWTGNLASGQSVNIALGGSVTYVAGQFYALQASVTNPNGQTDPNTGNNNIGFFGSQTGLLGNYTINSALATGGTNFQSFTDLAGQLSFRGICGPVVVTVAPGSGPYNEQVTFNAIPGSSSVNTVTVIGNNQDLSFDPNTIDRFVLRFNGADFVRIEDLNIIGTNSTFGYGIVLTNQSDNITIDNCDVNLSAVTSTVQASSCGICVTGSTTDPIGVGANANNLLVQNSRIFGSASGGPAYGITLAGSSPSNCSNNRIINCEIRDYLSQGVRGVNTEDAVVEGCQIGRPNRTATAIQYSIYFTGTNNLGTLVRGNLLGLNFGGNLTSTSSNYHVYFTSDASAAKPVNIINNIVYETTGNGLVYPFYFSSTDFINILHNTVTIDQPSATTTSAARAIFLTGAMTEVRILNNIFTINRSGTGTKNVYYIGTVPTNFTSNNNNIWIANQGTNNNHVAFQTANRTSLADFQAVAAGRESVSVSVDPIYANPLGLDFSPTNVALNDIGQNLLTEVPTDFNGTARIATPDPGAMEFTPANNDAGVIALNGLPCPGSNSVILTVRNFGIANLTTVQVQATVNGTPLPNSGNTFTVNLAPGETGDVNLGNFNFVSGTSYTILANTLLPNASADANSSNDSFSITAQPALSGTYTIDGALVTGGTNFQTFAEAVNALNTFGVCSAVVFQVAPGTYTERIRINAINGASAVNTVTFEGTNRPTCILQNGTTLTADNYVIDFNGCSFVTVRNLTIRATGTTLGRVITLNGNTRHINILNNLIEGPVFTSSTTNGALIFSNSGAANRNDYTLIQGNDFVNGSYGHYSFGPATTDRELFNHILDNTFTGFAAYGVYAYSQDSANISGNIIRQNPGGTSATPYGIYAYYYNGHIESNEITIYGNTTAYGLWTGYQIAAPGSPWRMVNNMVSVNSASPTTGTVYGIYPFAVQNLDILHNTVRITGGSPTAARALYINTTGTTGGVRILNNIFANYGSGYTVEFTTIANTASYVSQFNFNGYDNGTNTTTPFRNGTVNYNNLAAWQAAVPWDANSVQETVVFQAVDNLRIVEGTLFNNAGQLGLGVDLDIDSVARCPLAGCPGGHARPDLGAHEFIIPDNDIRPMALVAPLNDVCGGSDIEVRVQIRNFGQATQTLVPVQVNMTGAGVSPASLTGNFTGSIAYDETGVATVGLISLAPTAGNDTLRLEIISQLPGDQRTNNDTLRLAIAVRPSPAFNFTQLAPTCAQSNGILSYNVTSGVSPFSGLWDDGGTGSPRLNLAAGTYTLTVTGGNGCSTAQTVTLLANNGSISLSASATDERCNNANGSATATAASGVAPYSYVWNTGATGDIVNNLSAGNFSVTVTDANGCVANTTVSLNNQASTVSVSLASSTDARCGNTGQLRAAASGGSAPYSYNWSNGQNTETATGLASGSYELTVTDNDGCAATLSGAQVNVDNSFAVSVSSQNVSCFGQTNGEIAVQATGAVGNATYAWANGQTTGTLNGLGVGNYVVTVSDASGCEEVVTITLTQPDSLNFSASVSNESSSGAADGAITLNLSGGAVPTYSIFWSNGASTNSLSNLRAGTYSVIVRDGAGCSYEFSIPVGLGTSIQSTELLAQAWRIFPNPTSEQLQIEWQLPAEQQVQGLEVLDALGRRVALIATPELAQYQTSLFVGDYAPGLYLIRLHSSLGSHTQTFIKR